MSQLQLAQLLLELGSAPGRIGAFDRALLYLVANHDLGIDHIATKLDPLEADVRVASATVQCLCGFLKPI